jgi:hypothetical protein
MSTSSDTSLKSSALLVSSGTPATFAVAAMTRSTARRRD